jgi:anti-sigma-K factor RskA
MTEPLPREDDYAAAEYALGVMPSAERMRFAARLATSPELQAAVAAWEMRLSGLADAVEPVAPPPHVKAALLATLFAPERKAGFWNNLWLWRGVSVASLAALAVMAGLYLRAPAPQGTVYVAELTSDTAKVRVIAYYEPQSGKLRLDRRAGGVQSGRSMELWLIDGDQKPKSLGLMPAEETGAVSVPASLREAMPRAVLAVSDEPQGGSPTGQPTGPVVAVGKVHSL